MATYAPSSEQPEQDEMMSKLSELMEEVNFLKQQVDDQSRLSTRWGTADELDGFSEDRPASTYDPANIMANLRGPDEGQAEQMYFGTDSHPIPPMLLRRFGPKFRLNQRVQVNPEAMVWGTDTTWGHTLTKVGSAGKGVIKKIVHLADSGEWKYQVRVQGLTNKQGSGFLEHELLPIKQRITKYVVEE